MSDEWNDVNVVKPQIKQEVMCWDGKSRYIARFDKYLTWKGYKLGFINLFTKYGLSVENVSHWIRLPDPPKKK